MLHTPLFFGELDNDRQKAYRIWFNEIHERESDDPAEPFAPNAQVLEDFEHQYRYVFSSARDFAQFLLDEHDQDYLNYAFPPIPDSTNNQDYVDWLKQADEENEHYSFMWRNEELYVFFLG